MHPVATTSMARGRIEAASFFKSLLKHEQSNGAQHGLSDPPPPPETTTHTHPDRSDLPGKNGGDCFAPAAQGLT